MVCQSARPIGWSRRDTPETIVAVKEHNAVLKALGCVRASKEH